MSRQRGYTTFRASPSRPALIEPGPRTARKPGLFHSILLVFAICATSVAIIGTAAMLLYLIVSGKV